jgi:hypothetical protein
VPLLSIADLAQPQEYLAMYIERAALLSNMYFDHIAQDQDESFSYKVDVSGSKGRAAGIHASEISRCQKLLVYSVMGTERKVDVETADVNMLMRFRIGTAVHAMIQNDWHRIAQKSGGHIRFDDEVRINPALGGVSATWGLHSSCDGVVTFLDQYQQPYMRVGIEIKTASADSFKDIRQPEPDHKEQTTLYMAALDLPLMWVLYYNKSNSNITTSYPPFLYQFDRQLWEQQLEKRFATAQSNAVAGVLPPGTEGMHCRWCPFSWHCKPSYLRPQGSARPSVSHIGMRKR